MTKTEIIKIIVVALIGAFTKSLFDNLLGKYIPDKKKLNSYIIKFVVFNLRYTLSAYFLINSFLDPKPIDKYFVFTVSIFTSVLFINLFFDIFTFYYYKFRLSTDKTLASLDGIMNALKKQNEILIMQDDTDNKIIDAIEKIDKNAFKKTEK